MQTAAGAKAPIRLPPLPLTHIITDSIIYGGNLRPTRCNTPRKEESSDTSRQGGRELKEKAEKEKEKSERESTRERYLAQSQREKEYTESRLKEKEFLQSRPLDCNKKGDILYYQHFAHYSILY